MTTESKDIVPVILAAGSSSRMGFPKALLPLGNGTFISTIMAALRRIELADPYIILGEQARQIRPALPAKCGIVLINPDPKRGQLSSMMLAVENLPPSSLGCLFWPVDQPHVSAELVAGLVRLFRASEAPIALPQCGARRGHPVIFHRDLYEPLLNIPPEEGARRLVMRHEHTLASLTTDERAVLEDIDTPEEYHLLTGEPLETALSRYWGSAH